MLPLIWGVSKKNTQQISTSTRTEAFGKPNDSFRELCPTFNADVAIQAWSIVPSGVMSMSYPVEWRRRFRERYHGFFRRRVAIPGRATLLHAEPRTSAPSDARAARQEPRRLALPIRTVKPNLKRFSGENFELSLRIPCQRRFSVWSEMRRFWNEWQVAGFQRATSRRSRTCC